MLSTIRQLAQQRTKARQVAVEQPVLGESVPEKQQRQKLTPSGESLTRITLSATLSHHAIK